MKHPKYFGANTKEQGRLNLSTSQIRNIQVGKLDRGVAAGITFSTVNKILLVLDSALEFRESRF